MLGPVVGQVKIVGYGWPLGSNGVDLFDIGVEVEGLAKFSDFAFGAGNLNIDEGVFSYLPISPNFLLIFAI